jgi:hypothetical protein
MSGGPVYMLDKNNNCKIIGLTKGMLQYKQNADKAANYIFDFVIPATTLNKLRQSTNSYSKQESQQFNSRLMDRCQWLKQGKSYQGLNAPSLQIEHVKSLIQRKQMLDSASK